MASIVQKVAKLTALIEGTPRLSVRRIQTELGLSRSTTYRWLREIVKEMPVAVGGGVVYKLEPNIGVVVEVEKAN